MEGEHQVPTYNFMPYNIHPILRDRAQIKASALTHELGFAPPAVILRETPRIFDRYRCPITGRGKKIPVHVVICSETWEEIAYEHCFSYDWSTMCGYHYLMRMGHALNVLARYTHALTKHVYELGVRGLIDLARSTIAAPWIDAGRLRQIAEGTCQLRLE
jgi:hypothetical protein